MTHYVSFDSPCDVIDLSVYKSLKLPQYRTVEVIGVKNLPVDSINFKNSSGQVINLARSTGTDKENVKALKDSILNQGWDITKTPPIVEEENNTLYDGFSRHEALLNKDHQEAPYLVVKRKSKFTVDDVIDEIGLGANNHSPSRRASMGDFKKRFGAFLIRQKESGKEVTVNDGIEWFAAIPNTFSEERILTAIEESFSKVKASQNMEAFTKPAAQQKGADLLNLDRSKVFALHKQGSGRSKTYLQRVAIDIIEYYKEHGDVPTVVGFLSGVEAEKSEAKRKELEREVETINRAMSSLADCYKRDPDYNFIKLVGHLPQIIDEETDLIDC
tara:strand:+ start:148 stop:1137 length:990 start_codon:yes stop_codon:yes gene_type:complete